ncbi:MAG: hypothetical protein GWP91_18115, partial [Rhodobacterales bacterium]|nr:hypothetical protein [Rhodobacterales bacterium]
DCAAPLVTLQTGFEDTCGGGNTHSWPIGLEDTDCHAWTNEGAAGGDLHENSASAIGCTPDGGFTLTQYAGNLDCQGNGVTKTYLSDVCEQDIPPNLYTLAIDLSCCTDPDGADCTTGIPEVSIPGGVIYLNGETCTPSR